MADNSFQYFFSHFDGSMQPPFFSDRCSNDDNDDIIVTLTEKRLVALNHQRRTSGNGCELAHTRKISVSETE